MTCATRAETLRRVPLAALVGVCACHRADLDRTPAGCGIALGPLQRRVEVGHVDDEDAAEPFLGVGERAVLDLGGAVARRERGGRRVDSSTSVPTSTPASSRSRAYAWNAAIAGAMSSSVRPISPPSW